LKRAKAGQTDEVSAGISNVGNVAMWGNVWAQGKFTVVFNLNTRGKLFILYLKSNGRLNR